MPFLTVTGKGSWTRAEKQDGGGYKLITYGPGVHEVDEATATIARKKRAKGDGKLVVTDTKPRTTTDVDRAQLGGDVELGPTDFHKSTPIVEGMRHRRRGSRGVQISQTTPDTVEAADGGERVIVQMAFPCTECDESFPTAAPLEFHMSEYHPIPIEGEEAPPEPEPLPEVGEGLPLPDAAL